MFPWQHQALLLTTPSPPHLFSIPAPIPSISISAPSISTPQSHSSQLYPFLSFTSTFPSFFLPLSPPLSLHTKTPTERAWGGGANQVNIASIDPILFLPNKQVSTYCFYGNCFFFLYIITYIKSEAYMKRALHYTSQFRNPFIPLSKCAAIIQMNS